MSQANLLSNILAQEGEIKCVNKIIGDSKSTMQLGYDQATRKFQMILARIKQQL